MTQPAWDQRRFGVLLTEPDDLGGLVAAIDALSPAERAAASRALGRELPGLRHRLEQAGLRHHAADTALWHRGVVLVALLDTTPAQVASMVTAWPVWNLWEDREVFGRVREALLAHDRRWAAQLVEAILREPDVGVYTRLAHPLIVAHDLPLPGQPAFWQLWAHELSLPQPNQRWEEHFLAACAVPDVLMGISSGQADYVRRISRAVDILRKLEPTNDQALTRALIQVFARGDRPGAQRMALLWLGALGLERYLWDEQAQLLAALPHADNAVVKFAVQQLLSSEPAPEQLTGLALVVLPRKEKGPRRAVLKALARLDAPPAALLEAVEALSDHTDSATADLARSLLRRWKG